MRGVQLAKESQVDLSADAALIKYAGLLYSRCVQKLLVRQPNLEAVFAAELTAVAGWIEVENGLSEGTLRGEDRRWHAYQEIVRTLREYRLEYQA